MVVASEAIDCPDEPASSLLEAEGRRDEAIPGANSSISAPIVREDWFAARREGCMLLLGRGGSCGVKSWLPLESDLWCRGGTLATCVYEDPYMWLVGRSSGGGGRGCEEVAVAGGGRSSNKTLA